MSVFWLGAVSLACIALLLVFFPWVKNSNQNVKDKLSNTQIIKQRISELQREVAEGLLSEEDKEQAIKELKLALLDETQPEQPSTVKHPSSIPAVLMALGAIIVGTVIYWSSNEISSIEHWQQVTADSKELADRIVIQADPNVTMTDIEDFALAMRTRLRDKPDDAIGWLLLGRLHASSKRLDSAIEAFERAYQLDPNHQGVLSSYSQALLMTGQEGSIRQAQRLIRRSLELDPEDVNALGMLAVTTTQLGEDQEAIAIWQQLKEKLPPTDPMVVEIDKRIDTLKGETSAQTSVLITVSIDDALAQKIPENAYLFVFAQDPTGKVRMPAAVVKNQLGALPVQIKLSDANAMMPSYKLSQLKEAKLVARISIDQNVASAPGELQGEVVVELQPDGQISQQIIIDKELM